MAYFNAIMVLGRLVADPELKYAGGMPVCKMRVASSKKFKKADGTMGERKLFIDVDAWRRLAEICAQFLKKGREVFISGELGQHEWQNDEGQKRSKYSIQANTVQFIGAPKETVAKEPGSDEEEVEPEPE